jgi:RAB protein geranylgeranyltransferase component A
VPVPAARSDIFLSKELSIPEKRLLMRFLSNCMEAEQGVGRFKVGRGVCSEGLTSLALQYDRCAAVVAR